MRYLIVLLTLMTAGCFASETVRLFHPTSNAVTCGPYQSTPQTQALAHAKLRHCVQDFKEQGFVREME